MPAAAPTSGAAIACLICGLLFYFPVLTSLLAFILGLVGISSAKDPAVRGRGMAVAGLILGVLGLLGWGTGIDRGVRFMQRTQPERTFSKTYVTALTAGNLDSDLSRSIDKSTRDSLQTLQQRSQGWGSLQSTIILAFPVEVFQTTVQNGVQSSSTKYVRFVTGVCQFTNGQHQFQMGLVKDSSGKLKVDTFNWTQSRRGRSRSQAGAQLLLRGLDGPPHGGFDLLAGQSRCGGTEDQRDGDAFASPIQRLASVRRHEFQGFQIGEIQSAGQGIDFFKRKTGRDDQGKIAPDRREFRQFLELRHLPMSGQQGGQFQFRGDGRVAQR